MPVLDLKTHVHSQDHVSAAICVIGGSLAGLTLATRLAQSGQKVVVLESGDSFDSAVHEPGFAHKVSGDYPTRSGKDHQALDSGPPLWGRMGSISPFQAGPRDHVGLPAWPFPVQELTCYERDIRRLCRISPGANQESAPKGDPDLTLPCNDADFEGRWLQGASPRSIEMLYGKQLRTHPNIELWLNAATKAVEVDRETGRLQSVSVGDAFGRHLAVRADHFMLASGTIETTRLLLWLKGSTSGQAFARAPLGLFLQDHIRARVARVWPLEDGSEKRFRVRRVGHRVQLELTPTAQQSAGVASATALIDMRQEQRQSDLSRTAWAQVFGLGSSSLRSTSGHVELCVEQMPDERNFVELSRERDAVGLPRARLHWRSMPADERTLRTTAERLTAYWARHGLDQYFPLEWIEACRKPEGQISDAAMGDADFSGTARMGTNRNSSVVGPDLLCHDVPNLSVVSAAVFPSAGSASPLFTLLALAMRHADTLLTQQARGSRLSAQSTPKLPAAKTISPVLS